jgi:hypothetical protein
MALTQITGDGLATSGLPAGTVLQVVQTTKTDTFTTTNTDYVDVTGLSVNITPTSSSNKILFIYNLSVGGGDGADVNHVIIQMMRGSTRLNIGDARGSNRFRGTHLVNTATSGQMFQPSAMILDSPSSTSQQTYKVQIGTTAGGYTACINRSGRDADNSAGHDGNASSTITVMEIAG